MPHAGPCSAHNPIHCVVPPFILERLAQSEDRKVRERALANLQLGAEVRAMRAIVSVLPSRILRFGAVPGPARMRREVYDQGNRTPPDRFLPGKLRRSEHGPATHDPAVDEAYNYAGSTWRLYNKIFGRNSLDDQGMTIVQSVHAGVEYDNAFWDGRQMVYGDGDGVVRVLPASGDGHPARSPGGTAEPSWLAPVAPNGWTFPARDLVWEDSTDPAG